MKKFLLFLFISAAAISGCKKDTGSKISVSSSDVAVIANQLKGTWLFPTNDQIITDDAGNELASNGYAAAPALQFDGGSSVSIIDNLQNKSHGTYQLSTKDGLIYLDITDASGNDVTYQVLVLDKTSLKLVSKVPYTYYNNASPVPALVVSNITLQRQTAADITGNLVTVFAISTSVGYNIDLYVTHAAKPDTAILLDSQNNFQGRYSFSFPAKTGDQLNADIVGDYTKTAFYAYYNGIPMSGGLSFSPQEFKTTTGWLVP